MAVNPTTFDHATHDELLLVAFACDDLAGPDAERAAALVAGCGECRRLVDDIRDLRTALPALPPARRRRDFRLTEEDARRLRPRGWRGALGWLAGPRLAFAAPVGTAVAALGVAGLLVATAPSVFLAGTASAPASSTSGIAAQGAESAAGAGSTGDVGVLTAPAATAPGPMVAGAAPTAGPSSAASAAAGITAPSAAPGDRSATSPPLAAAPNPAGAAAASGSPEAVAKSGAAPAASAERTALGAETGGGGPSPLLVGSSLLLVVGLVLVLGRLVARRVSRG